MLPIAADERRRDGRLAAVGTPFACSIFHTLMATCLGDVMRPDAALATVHLMRRLGVAVHFPERQTCCGQPFYNSGFLTGARDLARHTIEVFSGDRAVVVPSGSCAAMVKNEFPHLFHDDAAWHDRATELSARTFELS